MEDLNNFLKPKPAEKIPMKGIKVPLKLNHVQLKKGDEMKEKLKNITLKGALKASGVALLGYLLGELLPTGTAQTILDIVSSLF